MAQYQVGRSEDEVGEKLDRCITDSIVKTGAGAALGVVFSVLMFKRKMWPVSFGLGTGLGMAVSNCQHEFRKIYPTSVTVAAKVEEATIEKQSDEQLKPVEIETEQTDKSSE